MNEMTQVLGTVAMEPKGEYNSETYYEKLNTVQYNDSTYMAKEGVQGETPSTSEKWQLIGGGTKKEDTELVFDTVADMKAATLKDGYTVRTLGYYSVNDGGGATYKITDTESEDEYQEEVGDLYASLFIEEEINPLQVGAKCDGLNDDAIQIRKCFEILNKNGGGTLNLLDNKTYTLNSIENSTQSFFTIINNCVIKGLSTLKIADNFGDYKAIFFFNQTGDNVENCVFRDFTINDNSYGNNPTANTGTSDKERVDFRFLANSTSHIKNVIFENIKINDCLGVWQYEFEGKCENIKLDKCIINYNSDNLVSYDRTSIYLGANYGTITNCVLNGNVNARTGIELHGNNVVCSNNIINNYNSGIYLVNDKTNSSENANRMQMVCNNEVIARFRGIMLWLSFSNRNSELFDIHSNYVKILSTENNNTVGIGMYDTVGSNTVVENIKVYDNTIESLQSNVEMIRFVSTTSGVNTLIKNLEIKNNTLKGLMNYPFRISSNSNNTFKLNNLLIKSNNLIIDNSVEYTIYLLSRQGFKNIIIKNNQVVYNSEPTRFVRIAGSEDEDENIVIENNDLSFNFLPTNLYNSENCSAKLIHNVNDTIQLSTENTYNLLNYANFKITDGSIITDNNYTFKKADGKWICQYNGDSMPKHVPTYKGSLFVTSSDTNIVRVANKNGFIPDHIAGTNLIGEWVTASNELYVYKSLTNNSITSPTTGSDFAYVGEHAKFDILL